MADLDEIRAHYDLATYIAGDLGEPKREGAWLCWNCPRCDSSSRTGWHLKVNTGVSQPYVTCFRCNVVTGGSILDYVAMRQGLDINNPRHFVEVVHTLSDGKKLEPVKVDLGRAPRRKMTDFIDKVSALRENVDLSREYFNARGIDRVDERLLTKDTGRFFYVNHQYKTLEGFDVFPEVLKTPRYVIPHLVHGHSFAVQTRRDDELCRWLYDEHYDLMHVIKIDMGERLLADLTARGQQIENFERDCMPDRDEVIDRVFGARYKMWKGSTKHLYNISRVITAERKPIHLTAACITEGEITAASLEDITPEAGFAALAAKSYRNLKRWLKSVDFLFVLGEHDTPRLNRLTGEMESASLRNIESILHACGRWHDATARIVMPPKEHKGQPINDFNDFIQIDRDAAVKYLQGEGVPLVPRQLLAV